MKSKLIYVLIGAMLLLGFIRTSAKGIDDNTLELIVESQSLDTNKIWKGYDIEKYPIDVNYGNKEYRYFKGEITKKEPDIRVLALSAIDSENGPLVKVLPENQVRKITDSGDLSLIERNKIYKSVIVHEAFHCYQMENGATGATIDKGKVNSDDLEEFEKYKELMARIDNDETYNKYWINEMKDLEKYYKTGEKNNWIKSRDIRINYEKEFFGDDFEIYRKWVNNRELIEGTARYVEQMSLAMMDNKQPSFSFSERFIKGDGKFYESGCLKSMILDNEKEWKDIRFDDSISLDELLVN